MLLGNGTENKNLIYAFCLRGAQKITTVVCLLNSEESEQNKRQKKLTKGVAHRLEISLNPRARERESLMN